MLLPLKSSVERDISHCGYNVQLSICLISMAWEQSVFRLNGSWARGTRGGIMAVRFSIVYEQSESAFAMRSGPGVIRRNARGLGYNLRILMLARGCTLRLRFDHDSLV